MLNEIINLFSDSLELIPSLVLLSATVLFISLWVSHRSHRQVNGLKKELKQARNDLKALTTTSLGIGGRLLEIERRQKRIIEKQKNSPQPVLSSQPVVDIYESANQPYDHAIHLAQQGKEVEEIVSICGISQNEAELIKMMHRLEQAS
ncbi:hypothetical protein MNBD_GAMMA21-1202 [hydrothermal vent metagenome]|uniref:DUF2802 domain-containing protein n=1 Tax=hydrothermal vent metagenome TaxID=652676 RepID=A0A3B1AEI9_9ZZZZ